MKLVILLEYAWMSQQMTQNNKYLNYTYLCSLFSVRWYCFQFAQWKWNKYFISTVMNVF